MSPREAAVAVLAALLPDLRSVDGVAAEQRSEGFVPADQQLRDFFRRHPELGKRDRLLVGDCVFDVLRNFRLYQALAQAAGGGAPTPQGRSRDLVALAQPASGEPAAGAAADPPSGLAHPVDGASPAASAAGFPAAVRYSLPDWLWDRLQTAHGDRAAAIAAALLQPSPIDLRTNLLVGKPAVLRQRLAERGVEAVAIDGVPAGLRVVGRPNLEQLDLFAHGWFEVQDAGSQWIADACGARRGHLVIDFCAGAGGKSLALAARMRNAGKVLAFDTAEERLARVQPRAKRAGARIVETLRIDGLTDSRLGRYRGRADVVLVDAPCSGTGTLRRSPDLKWRLTPQRLAAHVREQAAILQAASALVKPGGTLVYATCSLLAEENEWQAAAFERSGFELVQQSAWLPDEGPSSSFFLAKWVLQVRF